MNRENILVVESPLKGRRLGQLLRAALHKPVRVIATYGRLYDFHMDDSIVPTLHPVSCRLIDTLESLSDSCTLYIGTDPDHAGEMIGVDVLRACRRGSAISLRTSSLTNEAIERAISEPVEICDVPTIAHHERELNARISAAFSDRKRFVPAGLVASPLAFGIIELQGINAIKSKLFANHRLNACGPDTAEVLLTEAVRSPSFDAESTMEQIEAWYLGGHVSYGRTSATAHLHQTQAARLESMLFRHTGVPGAHLPYGTEARAHDLPITPIDDSIVNTAYSGGSRANHTANAITEAWLRRSNPHRKIMLSEPDLVPNRQCRSLMALLMLRLGTPASLARHCKKYASLFSDSGHPSNFAHAIASNAERACPQLLDASKCNDIVSSTFGKLSPALVVEKLRDESRSHGSPTMEIAI